MKLVPIAKISKHEIIRNKENLDLPVYSVTNSMGLCKAEQYFDKTIHSKDLSKYKILRKGSIAYNPVNIKIGSICSNDKTDCLVSPLYEVIILDNSKILNDFFIYYLRSPIGQMYVKNESRGAVRITLKYSNLKKVLIPLPALEEQKNIVGDLNNIQTLIRNLNNQKKLFDDLIRSRFYEMFGDPITNNKKMKTLPINECVSFELPQETSKSIVWNLNLDMVESNTGNIINKVMVEKNKLGPSVNYFNSDYILYSKLRPYLNKVVVPNQDGYATTELVPIKPKSILNRIYFAHVLRSESFVTFINSLAFGTKMPRAPMKDFKKFQLIVPPIHLQNEFAEFVNKINELKENCQKQITLFEELLNKKMEGYFG